jgi:hypothetical protein
VAVNGCRISAGTRDIFFPAGMYLLSAMLTIITPGVTLRCVQNGTAATTCCPFLHSGSAKPISEEREYAAKVFDPSFQVRGRSGPQGCRIQARRTFC